MAGYIPSTPVLLALVLVAYPNHGQALWCSEPSEPYCIDDFDGFTRMEFDSCRYDVEAYLRDVEDYVRCLADEQERVSDQANEAVEKFNCLASGESYC